MIAVGSTWRRKGRPDYPVWIIGMVKDGWVYPHREDRPWETYGWREDRWRAGYEPTDPVLLAEQARCELEDAALAAICTEAAV